MPKHDYSAGPRSFPRRARIAIVAALLLAVAVAALNASRAGWLDLGRSAALPGAPLSPPQRAAVTTAVNLMSARGLSPQATLAERLLASGRLRGAAPGDRYLAASERAGDTPYAYTDPDDRHPHAPLAIVLAPRYFSDATDAGRAAVLVHELAHWQAFRRSGRSTEYDGYKAEFDAHRALGLGESDGLVYFMLLDGVEQYVVPRDRAYARQPEIKAYNSGAM